MLDDLEKKKKELKVDKEEDLRKQIKMLNLKPHVSRQRNQG